MTSIGWHAFSGCSSLTSITFGDNSQLTSIGGGTFSNCSSLTSITIPDGVTSIGDSAFSYCSKLKYNEYDNAVYLGNAENPYHALIKAKNTSITDCTINDSTKVIAGNAFYDCSSLASIEIPDSVTSIGGGAFSYCRRLTSIEIPSSVISIGDSPFEYCSKLKYNEYDNAKYLGNAENPYHALIKAKNTSITDCTINDSTKVIGGGTFSNCSSLTNIEIPNSVTSIGGYAFYNCSSLTSIEIPDSVTSIGDRAFYNCSSLTSIKIFSDTVEIYDSYDTISSSATIYGYKGSTAETYAKKYNRKFIPLECDEHNFGDTYKHDDTNHWLECSVCHSKKDITAHIFDNACDTTCDVCGYTRAITHSYEQKHDETNHWLECSVCHEKKDEAAHTFRQRFDKTHHWNECSCGFTKDKSEHTLDEEGKCTECRFGRVMLGDLNGDGKISAIDLTLMRKYIAGYKVDMIEAAADLNGDGRITAIDLTMLRKYIAGLITEF